jgi:integration host factor subunit beta
MTKSELIDAVAERTSQISKRDAAVIVDKIFQSMEQALRRGERIEIRGFGSFQIKIHPAHDGRNPATGQPMPIPARRRPFFKASKELRELVNEAPATDAAAPAGGIAQESAASPRD